jgi:hypothetical protein
MLRPTAWASGISSAPGKPDGAVFDDLEELLAVELLELALGLLISDGVAHPDVSASSRPAQIHAM